MYIFTYMKQLKRKDLYQNLFHVEFYQQIEDIN